MSEDSTTRPARARRTKTAAAVDDAPEPAPFTVKKWRGANLYCCRWCSKDSFDVQDIYDHVKVSHPGR